MLTVVTVATPELGDRSYLLHDGDVGVVVDPQRDLDRIEHAVAGAGVTVALVVETHLHNDYVSGGLALARRTGARYVIPAGEDVDFDRDAVRDGGELAVGALTLHAVATPGHTDHHTAYVVRDDAGPAVVCTGGSLLYGSVGRTDLVDPARTDALTRAQYRSARRLAELLEDDTAVLPTHGFGSFCSSGAGSGADASTIGEERRGNDSLLSDDEDRFVARLRQGLTDHPRYYAHMAPRNRAGAAPADLSPPPPVSADELATRVAAGEWAVDLRPRTAFAAAHVPGAIGIELDQQFSTHLGWLLPWGTPVTLLGEDHDDIAAAQRQLVRIGIDRPAGAAVGDPAAMVPDGGLRGYEVADFDRVAALGAGMTVLDVRRGDERADAHVRGSVHVPLHDLLDRLEDLPDETLWVHCASGYRAGIAASLLDRAGRDVVLIDDAFERATELGLTSTEGAPGLGRDRRGG